MARLELTFARRNGRTVLAHGYAEPPFRVGRCFPDGDGAHLILASSAPGIFGGDSFQQLVRVEHGARVRLTSQSAMQVRPAAGEGSRGSGLHPDSSESCSTYDVADDASLHCHWDALIPFARSALSQRIEVRLAASARLYWSDAFMAGRRALGSCTPAAKITGSGEGERWAFASLAHELRVTRGDALEYLERYCIRPHEGNMGHKWAAADASYFATALRSGSITAVADAERLHRELASKEGVAAASDATSTTLWVTRIMSATGVPFHQARQRARAHMSQ